MAHGSTRAVLEKKTTAGAPGRPLSSPRDLPLRQDLAQHRQALSLARRAARVGGLHALDGMLLAGALWVATSPALGLVEARPYVPAMLGILLLCLNALGAYHSGDQRRDRGRLFAGSVVAVLILGLLTVFPPHLPLSPLFLGAVGVASFVALAAGRAAADQAIRQVYLRGIGLRRALMIGSLDEVGHAIQQLRDDRHIDQYLVGHLAPGEEPDPTSLGGLADMPRVIEETGVQEVILATALAPRVIREVAELCFTRGIVLYVFPAVLGEVECRAEPVRVGRCPLLHLYPSQLQVSALLAKRAFDVVLAAVLLVALAPLLALIAVAIKLDSPGPAFFRQQRVGLGGRRFTMWKFRSMVADADAVRDRLAHLNTYGDSRLFKLANDPRITRVGRLLRRTSMDELPQLLNVVRGEMSLVGPRPPLPCEVAEYEPHHFDRLSVIPGITGPWQVSGRNLITDFEEVVRLERSYIRSWSLGLDLKILLRTIKVVVSGEGAL